MLVGRLTKDVEVRKTGTGKSVVNFTLAVNRVFDKDKADFITCIAWNHTADFMASYLGKGALVSVDGRIQTGSYEGTDGKLVYTTDVIVDNLQALESKAQRETGSGATYQDPEPKREEEPVLDIKSEDLPF